MTLICAAVNADTNVIVEKKIIIRITDSTSGGGSSGGGGGGGGGGSVSIPDTKIPTGIYEHGTVTVSQICLQGRHCDHHGNPRQGLHP